MSILDNPFVIYGYVGPECFCDRKEETQALIEALDNGGNVSKNLCPDNLFTDIILNPPVVFSVLFSS